MSREQKNALLGLNPHLKGYSCVLYWALVYSTQKYTTIQYTQTGHRCITCLCGCSHLKYYHTRISEIGQSALQHVYEIFKF